MNLPKEEDVRKLVRLVGALFKEYRKSGWNNEFKECTYPRSDFYIRSLF